MASVEQSLGVAPNQLAAITARRDTGARRRLTRKWKLFSRTSLIGSPPKANTSRPLLRRIEVLRDGSRANFSFFWVGFVGKVRLADSNAKSTYR